MNTELFITTPRLGTVTVDGTTAIVGSDTDFTASDVGKPIIIRTTAGDKRGVIATFTDAENITVAAAIDTTQSDCYYYIDYYNADLYDDYNYSLNYAIADIRNPESRNSSFSKTIKLPGTKANNIIFDNIFQIDLYGSFNPNIRAFIIVYSNYVPVFNGNLQLLKINRDGDKIEYEVSIFGKIGDLFQKVADKLLTDLDLSDLDELGTVTDITNTWAGGGDLFYPYMMNGRQLFTTATPAYISDQMAPAIRVSRIFEDILSSVGYSCQDTVTLYSETGMDKLYIPCLKEWRRKVFINFGLRGNYTTGGTGNTGDVYLVIDRIRTGTTESIFTGNIVTDAVSNISYQTTIELDWGDIVHFDIVPDIANVADSFTEVDNVNTYLQITYLDLNFNYNENGYNSLDLSGNVILAGAGTATKKITFNNEISDPNNTWATNIHTVPGKRTQGYLPDNYKQRDFLLALIKMFNLYLEPVFDNETQISILPRDTYYQNLNVVDWTEKLDVGQNIELIPMGELDWKEYLFSWKPDEDFHNKDYRAKTFETYGQRNVIVENDFIATKKKIDVEIAPLPLSGTSYNDMVLPICIKDGVSTVPNVYVGIMRMIYFNGTMEAGATTLDGGAQANYPFCGHLVGTPQTPTFDYNWAAPRYLYYNLTDPSIYPYTENLYTSFWQNFILEISDKYSKIYIAYFNLTAEDVRELDFSAKYFIDGTYFRLNKVIDYNPLGNQLTKCELIRINEAVYAAQVVSNGETQPGQAAHALPPYVSSSVSPGSLIIGDDQGNGVSKAITQDLELDSSARATVTGLRGIALDTAIPTNGQVYVYNSGSAKWEPQTPGGGGSGDVVGPASATADDIAVFNGTTGKLIKDGGIKISDLQLRSEKDASGGYAGLTLFKINFKNVANTFISFFTNSNTAARTYTFQDRNGTIADDTDLATKQATLTDVNFGSFNNGLTGKTTPVDADYTVLMDSADSNKEKKLSFANLWTWVKSKIESVVLALTNGTTATTQSANDNSTKVATTAYADSMALNKIDYWLQGVGATLNPADSTNYHFGLADATPATATANRRFKFAVGGTLKLAALTVLQANNGSNETVTVYLRNVTTATDTSIGTFTSDFGATTSATFNYSGLSVAVNNTDYYTLKIACPAWATNPSGWAMTCLLVIQ